MGKENKMKAEWKAKRGKHICVMCGNCVVACPNGALKFNKSSDDLTYDDEIIIDQSKCTGCGECVKVCPEVGSMIRLEEE